MALDIHRLEKGRAQQRLFSINDAELSILSPAFEFFKQSTGLTIDPYGDLKFSSGLKTLITAVQATMPVEPKKQTVYLEFLNFLENAEANDESIIFCGD